MDGNHPTHIDPQHKRRKSKDNPYTIFTTGRNTHDPRYYLSFRDVTGTHHRKARGNPGTTMGLGLSGCGCSLSYGAQSMAYRKQQAGYTD